MESVLSIQYINLKSYRSALGVLPLWWLLGAGARGVVTVVAIKRERHKTNKYTTII